MKWCSRSKIHICLPKQTSRLCISAFCISLPHSLSIPPSHPFSLYLTNKQNKNVSAHPNLGVRARTHAQTHAHTHTRDLINRVAFVAGTFKLEQSYARVIVYMHTRARARARTRARTHARTRERTHTRTQTYKHTNTHSHLRARARNHTYAYIT